MSGFRLDISEVQKNLISLPGGVDDAVRVYVETVAKDFESYAKMNRPWRDRTSRARQGLTGYVKKTEKGYRIVIAHTVDYGLWLEMAREKRYAILEPTIRLKSADAINGLRHLLERLKG